MSVSEQDPPPLPRRPDRDLPALRAGLAWFTAVGLCVAAALGISEILGASLGETAARTAGSGLACGFYGLFAVGASTLPQRSAGGQLAGVLGVLSATVAVALSLIAVWGGNLGETLARILFVAVLLAVPIGLTAFLVSQQRVEDPPAIRWLTLATATIVCLLAAVLIIDVVFSAGSTSSTSTTPASSNSGFIFSGVSFARFVGVSAVAVLLGTLLLPVLRRAHPAYRGGPADSHA